MEKGRLLLTAPDVMHAYAQATRGAWTVRGEQAADDVEMLAHLAAKYGAREDLDGHDTVVVLECLGLCPRGLGHWREFCTGACA